MIRGFSKLSGLLVLLLLLNSCGKDFLDIVPKGKRIASTVQDYTMILNNPTFFQVSYSRPGVVMGDEVAAMDAYMKNATVTIQRGFAWEDRIFEPLVSPLFFDNQLASIYSANKVINEVMNASDGTEMQRRSLLAEALANRAWMNFEFITHYAKPYNPTTASTDPGFPIILTADISVKTFARSSVQECYDHIINDLKSAIPDLPVENVSKLRMSKPAAKAFLGKVYLFMGRTGDARTQFDAAFADLAIATSAPALYDYNKEFGPNGLFTPGRFGPSYPGNTITMDKESLVQKTGVTSGADFANTGIVMPEKTMALYQTGDLRLNLYTNLNPDMITTLPGKLRRKYATQTTHTGIELADLLLLRAEALARENELGGAKADLERLRKSRMADGSVPAAIAADKNALITFILQERIREFAGEGQRWLDIRRLSVDPLFQDTSYTHEVYDMTGNIIRTYTLKPERLTLRFPQIVLDSNPGMTDNP